VRIWTRPQVRAGGRYRMDEGQIVVESIVPIHIKDVTQDLARESGFSSVKDLLQVAKHGSGSNVYLIRFHYLPPGAWDVPGAVRSEDDDRSSIGQTRSGRTSTLLQRIRSSTPPNARSAGTRASAARSSRRRKSTT
jgi:hypothetical protein